MIIFQKIKFKNFGSFGNTWTEINFEKAQTTLVHGNNGSGKSFALLDSLTFVLFGKPFRKINIPQLQNSINSKECYVEVHFSIANDKYKIVRGLAPKLFEIYKNGKLVNQEAKTSDYQDILEQQILKMNYKTFTQVVILGSSSFVPFMQLSAADRRAVIENILDINIFATMNALLKGKITSIKDNLREHSQKIESAKQSIEYQKKIIDKTKNSVVDDMNKINDELSELKTKKANLLSEYGRLQEEQKSIDLNHDLENVEKELTKINRFQAQVSLKSEELTNEKNFYEKEESCSKCKSVISKDHREKSIKGIEENLLQYQEAGEAFEKKKQDCEEKITQIKKDIAQKNKIESAMNKIVGDISVCDLGIEHREKKIKHSSQIETEVIKETAILEKLQSDLEVLEVERETKKEELLSHEYAFDIIRDGGVKSKIIKHYLPAMNKYINKYLASMDFFAQFHLDQDFNETIKSRHRDEFTYMNFSEGEKMRIDLALLLSWREIAKMKNSVNCNLLILDEIFDSSLDSGGTEEVLKLLNNLGSNTHVYIISHKADQIMDKFTSTIGFEKKGNFSKMLKQ